MVDIRALRYYNCIRYLKSFLYLKLKFNEKLIKLRKASGLSQEELGNKLNVARQTVSKWELGETTPELEKLIELSEIFNVSIDKLVGKEESETLNEEQKIFYGKVRLDYEYKSKIKIKGIPLVHINIGFGIRKAKGIIAIGNIAQGVLAIGGLAMGLLALGGVPLGLISLGGIAIALLLACGGLALAPVAIGGVAIGIISIGGLAIGIYSFGGAALASNIGVGGYASGHIAIGEQVSGDIIFKTTQELSKENIVNIVLQEFPKIPRILLNLIKMFI